MFVKRCRCCQTEWTTVEAFVDDLSLIPAGTLEDPNPAYSLAAFVHECGEVVYVEQQQLDQELLERRMQTVAAQLHDEAAARALAA